MQIKVRNTGVPIQISPNLLKTLNVVCCEIYKVRSGQNERSRQSERRMKICLFIDRP